MKDADDGDYSTNFTLTVKNGRLALSNSKAAGLTITGIRDITPVPHNGCRARKRRRV